MKISTLIFTSFAVVCVLVILFSVFLTVSSKKENKTNPADITVERRIVAFGDSLTYGYGLQNPSTESYPALLEKKLASEGFDNYKVINLGVSGETTADGLKRLDSAYSYEPNLVILEFGANDYLKRLSPIDARANLKTMIDYFDKKDVKVLLVNIETSPLLPFPNKEEYSKIIPELAKEYGLIYVPSFMDNVLLNEEFTIEDKIHPNTSGYAYIVNKNLWPILQKVIVK